MPVLQTYQKVVHFFALVPSASIRTAAKLLQLSKSAVHRHQQPLERRTPHPESALWNTPEGVQWLCRLVIVTLYCFGLQKGMGGESLSLFFQALRIDSHLGVSPTTLRSVMGHMEEQLLEYEAQCQQTVASLETPRPIVAGVDETFFEQMILVFMDLCSGFIFMETFSETRSFATWSQLAKERVRGWNVQVRYFVSDQAQALIKLAQDGYQCLHLPDLFHACQEVVKGLGASFQRRVRQAAQQVENAQAQFLKHQKQVAALPPYLAPSLLQPAIAQLQQAQQQQATLEEGRNRYHQLLRQISQTLHPFSPLDSSRQTSSQALENLNRLLQDLHALKAHFHLADEAEHLGAFAHQKEGLVAAID